MSRKNIAEVQAARAFSLKNYPRAIIHLSELLECVGENPHTLHLLALCYARQNDIDQALPFVRRALQADDRHLESLKLLAQIHLLQNEHRQARECVARALELHKARREEQPLPGSWISTMAAALGWRNGKASRPGLGGANEDRRWLEWAEAFIAAPPPDDAH
jgi:tetratricopeptide (TPR) repeat protein